MENNVENSHKWQKKTEYLKDLVSFLIINDNSDDDLIEALFVIFYSLIDHQDRFGAINAIEDLTFHLFTYAKPHDEAYRTWRDETLAKFSSDEETKKPVLGLSDSSMVDLSQKLSDIMSNPNLPTKIYNCLADEFAEVSINTNTPENILRNLKKLSGNKKGGAK